MAAEKVLVAMSGGVDSSVAASLLQEQGFDPLGVTMKLMEVPAAEEASPRSCCAHDAARDARRVCDVLGIAHYTVNAVEVFGAAVIDNFISEYECGRTPNPCVRCNALVKFDWLLHKADELGCAFLATGHYARLNDGRLYRGDDRTKDQSYFLYPVYGSQPDRIIFPCGGLTKDATRRIAATKKLPTAAKQESQDICFVSSRRYGDFLASRGPSEPGDILDIRGSVIGRHTGIRNYTVGQRKGLGALGRRMFVKEIRPGDNTIVAAEDDMLRAHRLIVADMVVGPVPVEPGRRCEVQIRYNSSAVPAVVEAFDGAMMHLRVEEGLRAVAPGQSAVLFAESMVLGGGIIEK